MRYISINSKIGSSDYSPIGSTVTGALATLSQLSHKMRLDGVSTLSVKGNNRTINATLNELYTSFTAYRANLSQGSFVEVTGLLIQNWFNFVPLRRAIYGKGDNSLLLLAGISYNTMSNKLSWGYSEVSSNSQYLMQDISSSGSTGLMDYGTYNFNDSAILYLYLYEQIK